jgi:DNA recombination protein RmuC
MDMLSVVLLLLGLGAGALVGALVGAAATRSQQAGRQAAALATLQAERDSARAEALRLATEATAWSNRAQQSEHDVIRLTAELAHAQEAGVERLADLQRTQEELSERFRLLSQDALDRTSARLVQLTDERLATAEKQTAAQLDQRRVAVENLVKPLSESLEQVRVQLTEVEKTRVGAYAELREQVQSMNRTSDQLRVETAQLVTALRAPQARGRWGEMQLRRVVESAGMVEHCDFAEQANVTTEDGMLRPDMVVRLAGGKNVVVDAKVAFSGYLEAMEAKDDTTRTGRLKAHARHLRDHIDRLSAKSYWEQFQPSPEFVVMFVPAEVFLSAALEEDPTLLEHAFARDVVIATPQTLIALLRTIAYTWRQEAIAANAQQVYQLGRELHGRLATMGGHLAKLGAGIEGAVKAYNNTVSSLESRVLVTARRLSDLRVTDEELLAPAQVEIATRQVQAPELVASATDALVVLDPKSATPIPSSTSSTSSADPARGDLVVAAIEDDPRYGVDADAPPSLFSLPRPAERRSGGA